MSSQIQKQKTKEGQKNQNPQTKSTDQNIGGIQIKSKPNRFRIFKDNKSEINDGKSKSPVFVNHTPISPSSQINKNHHTTNTAPNSNLDHKSSVRINYQSPVRGVSPGRPSAYRIYYTQQIVAQQQLVQNVEPKISIFNPTPHHNLILTKTPQMLQYEIMVLTKQLQQRDDIILMFKKNPQSTSSPINDQLIKDLNLKICQKNTLIEQIHRNLVEFQQKVQKQKLEISPICKQRFQMLKDLINYHETHPIIVRQRFIQTGVGLIVTAPHNMSDVQLQQKLVWYQNQYRILQRTILQLKSNSTHTNTSQNQSQRLRKQIAHLQQQIRNYKQQIFQLCKQAEHNDNASEIQKLQENQNSKQLQNLKAQIKRLNDIIFRFSLKDEQIIMLKEDIQKYKRQYQILVRKQVQYTSQINLYKIQITQLKNKANSNGESRIKLQMDQLSKSYNVRINQIQRQLQGAYLKINQLQQKIILLSNQSENWKNHLTTAQTYIEQLLKQIQNLKTQISSYKINNTELNNKMTIQNSKLTIQNSKLTQQISVLSVTIKTFNVERQKFNVSLTSLEKQINRLKVSLSEKQWAFGEIAELKREIDSLRLQLGEKDRLNGQVNTLRRQIQRLKSQLKDKQTKIRKQSQQTITNLRLQIQNYHIEINNLKQEIHLKIEQINSINSRVSAQAEIEKIRIQWDNQVRDLWGKLNNAELYILEITGNLQSVQNSNTLLSLQIERLTKQKNNTPDQYMYKLDQKYLIISQKLRQISQKSHKNIKSQSEFLEQYRIRRKNQLEQIQSLIKQSLYVMKDIQQTIVVKRSELYRLDLVKLEEFVREISLVKQNKSVIQAELREDIQTKFFGILQSVSTVYAQ